jgi:type I restriction enzyme M protein
VALTEVEAVKNDLPDLVKRWFARDAAERERLRTAQSFCVAKVVASLITLGPRHL